MSTNAVNVAVVDGKTISETTELRGAKSGDSVRIKAVTNGRYILAEGDKGVAPENITIKRVGKDLHIALEGTDPDQPQLIIEGFFESQGQLVGVAEDGAYYEYISSDAEQDHSAPFLIDGVSSPQVLGSEQLVGFGNGLVAGAGIGWFWPALLGLAGVGLLGAAYAANHDDDDDDNNNGSGIPPDTPSLDSVVDNVGDKTGRIESGGSTDDTTPTFSGVGTPGNTIVIKDGDNVIGEVIVGEDGKWEFTPDTPLGAGPHIIVVVEKDPEGNESAPSDGFEFVVDLTAPGKSIIDNALDDFGPQTGSVGHLGRTDDNTPTLTGRAELGSTVEIFANGEKIGEVPVNADGTWSFTPSPPLADGEYNFTTVAVDAAGNRGLASDPYTLTIDTCAPRADALIQSIGKDSGSDSNDFITNDGTAGRLIQGSLTAALAEGEKVQVSVDNGATWMDALLNGDGTWSFVDETAHSGDWEIKTRVVDEAGNHGAEQGREVILDDVAPDAPVSVARVADGTVLVDIRGTNAAVGDTVFVNVGNEQFSYILKEFNITNGLAVISFPTGITGGIETYIVDAAGNSSDAVGLTLVDHFVDLPFDFTMPEGGSIDRNYYSVTNVSGAIAAGSYLTDTLLKLGSNLAPKGIALIEMELPVTRFDFNTVGVSGGANNWVYYKDQDGNVIHSQQFNDSKTTYSFIAPPGVNIAEIEFHYDADFGVELDQIKVTADPVLDPQNQLIENSNQYYGSDGNDSFFVSDVNNLTGAESGVHGAGGLDTLTLTGQNQILDLTDIGHKLSSIEVIDITGTGDNTLKLSLDDVLNNGETNLFHDSGKVQMMVNGDAGDVLDLEGLISAEDPGSWGAQGQVTVGGVVYEVYSHSSLNAELLVQQGVDTNLV